MNDYKKYWVWLSTALGAASRTDEIFGAFARPHDIFEASETERMISGVFTKKQLEKLNTTPMEKALHYISLCDKNGWQVVTPDCELYPADLKKLTDIPLVLYVDGSLDCLTDKVAIGVVGTRNPCYESIAVTRSISGELAKAGAVVVSGGALGIDSAAHEAAMEAGGKTVCVMGCGLGTDYLRDNEAMRRQIKKNGALVTEYPPFASASRVTFPQRNRIISGLSKGVLVVEAGERSGSLITARLAAEQGREVFAIPGSVLSTAYMGANSLIRDGAKAASCARDILKPYALMYPDRLCLDGLAESTVVEKAVAVTQVVPQKVKKECPAELDPDRQAVYNLIGEGVFHPDEICAATGFPLSKVISVLMRLEIEEYIEQTEGKNYILK
mgnify:CR=1 FL=1